ncbi:MAG: response regulator [Anaerolineae bacterium]
MKKLDSAHPTWRAIAADDDESSLLLVCAALDLFAVAVYEARNGLEVLELLTKIVPPTFILLDISMPKLDGWETLEQIKATPAWSNIPVIALTAYALDSERERARTSGFSAYLIKPLSPSALIAEIERIVRE